MDCSGVREHITAHAQGELEAPGLPELIVHLTGCADCRKAYHQVCKTLRFLHAVPDQPLPAASWSRLAAKLPPQDQPGTVADPRPLAVASAAGRAGPDPVLAGRAVGPAGTLSANEGDARSTIGRSPPLRLVTTSAAMPEPRRRGPSSLTMRHAGMWAAAALVVVWGVWFTKEQALEREVQNPGARNSSESVAVFLGPKPNADGASLMRGVERSVSAGKFDQMCLQVGGDLEIEGPASYSFASRTRCRLLSCTSARFDLPRLSGPFGVETPAGTIEVVGTKFRVTVSTDVTRVFLEQGAITLTNNLGSCRALPNSFSVMRAESPPVSMTFTEALPGWTFGRWGRRHEGDLGVALCLVGPEPRVNEDVEIGCTLQRMERDVRWPLDFEPISSASPYYLLTITPPSGSPYTINLSKCHPTEVEPLPTKSKTAGLLTLQPRQTYTVRCRIPQMFKTPGRYLVTALYGSGSALPASTTDQTWSGLIESSPITVDVR